MTVYLRYIYGGNCAKELQNDYQKKSNIHFTKKDIEAFEKYLNDEMPKFEEGMFDYIKVQQQDNSIKLYIVEKDGKEVDINCTSTGRKWYLTYYFAKSVLEKGDYFIIDEPANSLHPKAQKEVKRELEELASQGVNVIYSTHSPYLLPEGWTGVHFVEMSEYGTEVAYNPNKSELKDALGIEDIFDIEDIIEKYNRDDAMKIKNKLFEKVLEKGEGNTQKEKIDNVAQKINISSDTIKDWRRKSKDRANRRPSFENFLHILISLNIEPEEILE